MNAPSAELSLTELSALLGIPRHELDYRVKRGRLAIFRPSGNPRGNGGIGHAAAAAARRAASAGVTSIMATVLGVTRTSAPRVTSVPMPSTRMFSMNIFAMR